MLLVIAFLFVGYLSDPLFYFFALVIAFAMINDIKCLGLEMGGPKWKITGKLLHLGIIAVGTLLVAIHNIVYTILGLAVFLAIAGSSMIPQGKTIRKHTVFQDRFQTLLVIIVSLIAILLVLRARSFFGHLLKLFSYVFKELRYHSQNLQTFARLLLKPSNCI